MSEFKVFSSTFEEYQTLQKKNEFNGFDGDGQNISPHITWSGAPEGTKSFAVTMYDPDAPTGSGYWHWVAYDIPGTVTELIEGSCSTETNLSVGGFQGLNDYGERGYGGPCPPKGDKPHRYVVTVHALSVESLDIDPSMSCALVRFFINMNSIASTSLTTIYGRPAAAA